VPAEDRDPLMLHLKDRGVGCHVHFVPSHLHPAYKAYRTELLPVTESYWKTLVTLPLFPTITDDEIAQVIEGVKMYPKYARSANGRSGGVTVKT
jgi:dTDP-4-amino-4,6-dideoxygalactose transaminase